MVEVITVL